MKILRGFAPFAIGMTVILIASTEGLPGAIGEGSTSEVYGGTCCLKLDLDTDCDAECPRDMYYDWWPGESGWHDIECEATFGCGLITPCSAFCRKIVVQSSCP